jgi:hypothetical protein
MEKQFEEALEEVFWSDEKVEIRRSIQSNDREKYGMLLKLTWLLN